MAFRCRASYHPRPAAGSGRPMMTAIVVPGFVTFTIAIVVFFVGVWLNRLIAPLQRWNIPAIDHIDTRALVRHIRDKGAMRACLSTIDQNADRVIEKARKSPAMENRELASAV